ncbi:MAG: hypothetical protein ABR571_00870 [Jatrophihabitans sp.]|uniref:hypothetical protein n=1 Tax=Jatrophihabitans sp. TaxID=1932789 RepID=UPI00390F0CD3
MNLRTERFLLAILCLSAADVGVWALIAPRSFYDSFPGLGRHWIDVTGPYNEHFVRDVGGLYLALLGLSAWAALRPTRDLARVAGLAWSVFSLPHLAYHAGHLDEFGAGDRIGNLIALGGTAVVGLALFVAPWPATGRSAAEGVG